MLRLSLCVCVTRLFSSAAYFQTLSNALCFAVSRYQERSMPNNSSVSLACLRLLSSCLLCYVRKLHPSGMSTPQLPGSAAATNATKLQCCHAASLHLSLSLWAGSQKHTLTTNKSQIQLWMLSSFCVSSFPSTNIQIQIINTEVETDSLLPKLHQCGCTGNEEAKWAIALHGLSQLNQSHR